MSPYRDRPVEENLDLFERMKNGEFPEGSRTLRAKIDLASGNFNMRDPVIYRIRYMHHHRQGDKWCIYPMYDFAHPIQDALEGITHSLCSLEFEAHRPLYDWVVNNVSVPNHPRQIEFARLGIDHTVMSKRKLRQLVEQNYVSGWDDPRMPTLCGLRRRGYTSHSIRDFCERIGVAKSANTVEYALLEHCLREDLNDTAERTMAVLRPVKLVITNYPEDKTETFEVENNPVHPEQGTHPVTFSREVWIEAEDFLPEPIPKYKRLYPNGPECRLKGAYLITCTGCKQAADGSIEEIYATYDPDSRGGDPADGRKVKGATIHWVDSKTAVDAEVRLYGKPLLRRPARRPGQKLPRLPEPRIPCRFSPAARSKPRSSKRRRSTTPRAKAAWRIPRPASSSCASATSAWTPATAAQTIWSSTAASCSKTASNRENKKNRPRTAIKTMRGRSVLQDSCLATWAQMAAKVFSLTSCSTLQASSRAVFSSTPMRMKNSVSVLCRV